MSVYRAALLGLAIGALAFLSGCSVRFSEPMPEPLYLACTWSMPGSDLRLTLQVDGKAHFEDLPEWLVVDPFKNRTYGTYDYVWTGDGSWKLGGRATNGQPVVFVDLDNGTGWLWSVYSKGTGENTTLYVLVGSVDSPQEVQFEKTRCAADAVEPSSPDPSVRSNDSN